MKGPVNDRSNPNNNNGNNKNNNNNGKPNNNKGDLADSADKNKYVKFNN